VRIMIAGGGTGGHIYPGIAVAEALEALEPGIETLFMGRRGSIEERVVTGSGRIFQTVPSRGFIRGGTLVNVAVPFVVGAGCVAGVVKLMRRRPQAALGTGGFASLPPIIAAAVLGVPIALQEQNSCPGLATRVLSRWADVVHTTYEETKAMLPHARRVELSGNPIRAAFGGGGGLRQENGARAAARDAFGLSQDAPVFLLLGGSGGARSMSLAIADAAAALAGNGIEMIIQTGRAELDLVRESCRAAGATAVVESYFDDVADAYAACDLVVSRAGATTLAETAAVARPAILVPYPYATEGHQMKNARAVETAGAAVVIPDGELAGDSLARRIQELLRDRTRLARMAQAARTLARPDAAHRVAESVLALARGRGGA